MSIQIYICSDCVDCIAIILCKSLNFARIQLILIEAKKTQKQPPNKSIKLNLKKISQQYIFRYSRNMDYVKVKGWSHSIHTFQRCCSDCFNCIFMIPGLINKILTRQHQYYVILQQTRLLKSVRILCCFKGRTSLEMVLKLVLSQAKHFLYRVKL